jgi:DNA-binding transcriptional ArsR family regulator
MGTARSLLGPEPTLTVERCYWQKFSSIDLLVDVADWSFLTTHARAMLFLADQPEARLRDLASGLGVTERTAYGVVADLSDAGYVLKERDGRRNRYDIQRHLPLRDEIGRERSVGELLDLLGTAASPRAARPRRS